MIFHGLGGHGLFIRHLLKGILVTSKVSAIINKPAGNVCVRNFVSMYILVEAVFLFIVMSFEYTGHGLEI